MALTPAQTKLLPLLQNESRGNGHDFGILDQIKWSSKKALRLLMEELQEAGVLTLHDTDTNGKPLTQYVLAKAYRGDGAAPAARKPSTGDMSKVSGVWLKPTIAKSEEEAADLAFDGVRRRPVVAKNQKGELVVCSMRTARKYGWDVQGKMDGTSPRAPAAKKGEAKRKERLAKLEAATPAKKAAKPMEATAQDQWGKIAAKAAKAGTKGKKAAAALADMLGE